MYRIQTAIDLSDENRNFVKNINAQHTIRRRAIHTIQYKIFNRIWRFVAKLATSSENIYIATVIDKYIYSKKLINKQPVKIKICYSMTNQSKELKEDLHKTENGCENIVITDTEVLNQYFH